MSSFTRRLVCGAIATWLIRFQFAGGALIRVSTGTVHLAWHRVTHSDRICPTGHIRNTHAQRDVHQRCALLQSHGPRAHRSPAQCVRVRERGDARHRGAAVPAGGRVHHPARWPAATVAGRKTDRTVRVLRARRARHASEGVLRHGQSARQPTE